MQNINSFINGTSFEVQQEPAVAKIEVVVGTHFTEILEKLIVGYLYIKIFNVSYQTLLICMIVPVITDVYLKVLRPCHYLEQNLVPFVS